MMDRRVRFPKSVEDVKRCVPGPNVVFRKNTLPFSEYLQNTDNIGSLGCGPNQYPKYENDKYCCVNEMSTMQEKLDYVNNLLENAMDVTGITSFNKQISNIRWLIDIRRKWLRNFPNLQDNIFLPEPFTSVEDWFDANLSDLKDLSHYGKEDRAVDDELEAYKKKQKNVKFYREKILRNLPVPDSDSDSDSDYVDSERDSDGSTPRDDDDDDFVAVNKNVKNPIAKGNASHEGNASDEGTYNNLINIGEEPKQMGCVGRFCKAIGLRGGVETKKRKQNKKRKTKHLRNKYKKTINIKKRQIKNRKSKRI